MLALLLAPALGASAWSWAEGLPDAKVPGAAQRLCAQGNTQWRAGQVTDAAQSWRQAADLAPAWAGPRAGLAVVQQMQGRQAEARASYEFVQAAALGPEPANTSEAQRALRKLVVGQEAHLCLLVNGARLAEKVPPLLPDVAVVRIARQHSEEMRDLRYYGHESPVAGMGNVVDRFVRIFEVRPRCIAENVSRRWGLSCRLNDAKIAESHRGLMASSGHRANILYPTVQGMGLGLAANLTEEYWLTEVFVQPRE
jgi:uncharacterized protein YkwD